LKSGRPSSAPSERGTNSCIFTGGWIACDLRGFLTEHYFFEPTRRYLKAFSSLIGGYPIVLRQGNGRETTFAYLDDAPIRAGIIFSLDEGTVRITKCLADGSPLPAQALVAGECFIDPTEKTIQPVSTGAVETVGSVFDALDELYELTTSLTTMPGRPTQRSAFNYGAVT
jgi:hypothetical protein